MGGKASKEKQAQFERSSSIRRTQKQQFRHIKQKTEMINKLIKKLKPKTQTEDQYSTIKNIIMEVRFLLQNISPELIDKNRTMFDHCVAKCDQYMSALNAKFQKEGSQETIYTVPTPATPPATPVEIKVVQLVVNPEENTETPPDRKKVMKKRKGDKLTRKISKDEKSFEEIHELRQKMLPLREEILAFKGRSDDRTFHFLEECLLRCIQQLENVEVYDLQQLKHERKVAIDYAKESIDILRDVAAGKYVRKTTNDEKVETEINSDESALSLKSGENNRPESKESGHSIHLRNSKPEKSDDEEKTDFKKLLEMKLNATKRSTMGMLRSKYEVADEEYEASRKIQLTKSIEITEMDGCDDSYSSYEDTSTDDELHEYTLDGQEQDDAMAVLKVTKI